VGDTYFSSRSDFIGFAVFVDGKKMISDSIFLIESFLAVHFLVITTFDDKLRDARAKRRTRKRK